MSDLDVILESKLFFILRVNNITFRAYKMLNFIIHISYYFQNIQEIPIVLLAY